jgi:prepilin-type processing-associated H-X9-DG protein
VAPGTENVTIMLKVDAVSKSLCDVRMCDRKHKNANCLFADGNVFCDDSNNVISLNKTGPKNFVSNW